MFDACSVSNKEETAGGVLKNWPQRLQSVPPRIDMGTIEVVTSERVPNTLY